MNNECRAAKKIYTSQMIRGDISMAEQGDREFYKAKIRELLEKIDNIDFLIKIYSFIKVFVEE